MGNGQSAVEDRSPGRVAKPKGLPAGKNSGGSSPTSKYDTPNPSLVALPYSQYNGTESVAGSPTKQTVKLNQDIRQHNPSQLLAPEEHARAMGADGEKVDVLAVSLARSLSRSASRRATKPTLKASASKLSNNASQMSLESERTVDLETAVALLQELRKTATPEDLVALHRALLPTRSKSPLSNTADVLEERLAMSAAGLIRTKSLARPGVATRHSRKDLKPEKRQDKNQLWKPEMMGTSPLAKLSSLDDLEPDLQPPPAIAQNRAHTPVGDEYSNLGNLKRGSLMVMNGSASSASSFISADFVDTRLSEEEYFTASENDSKPDSPAKPLPALPTSPQAPDSLNQSVDDSQLPDQQTPTATITTQRSGSPLKREMLVESTIWESDTENRYPATRQPHLQTSPISLIAKSENHSLFSNMSSDEELRSRDSKAYYLQSRTVSQSAVSLAAEYMLEMPPEPHDTPAIKEDQEALLANSLHNSSASRSARGGREDSSISPQKAQLGDLESGQVPAFAEARVGDEILAHTALRSHPPNITMPLKSALKSKSSSQVKTDSGYCSSASTGVEAGQDVEVDPPNLSTADSAAELPVETDETVSSPAMPTPQSEVSERWPTFKKIEPDKEVEPDFKQGPSEESERPKADRRKSWRKSIRRSLSRSRTAETTPDRSSIPSLPDSSLSLESPKPRKLQKRRPISQPPLAVRDSHKLKGEVPPVPSSMISKFSDRLATSPGLQHLERTYENATSTNPRRGSASPVPASGDPPALTPSYFPDVQQDTSINTAKISSKQNTPDRAGPVPPIHRHGLTRRSFRRASRSMKEEEESGSDGALGVSDFGTVAQSLGSGPYDIAKGSQPQRPRSAGIGLVQYPHQLGADQGQYGPREGWDAETASKFAQTRSRERAAAAAAAERESVPVRRPFTSSRPNSSYEDSFVHEHQRPSLDRRPKSLHGSWPQWQGHAQQRVEAHDQDVAHREYQKLIASSTSAPPRRPKTANADTMPYDGGSAQQKYHRPTASNIVGSIPRLRTSNIDSVVHDHGPRSGSPVKNMVSVFEARAALAPTPSPTLSPRSPQSPTFDWSQQSRMWREKKANAREGALSPTSEYSESITSTTTSTMATYVAGPPSRPGFPRAQTSYASTPVTATRTVHSAIPTTTTHTTYLSTPVSRTSNNHTSTMSSTVSGRMSQSSMYSQQSTPTPTPVGPRMREQSRSKQRYHEDPIPKYSGGQAQPQHAAHQQRPHPERIGSGGVFGRFGGGYTGEMAGIQKPVGPGGRRRDGTPRTQAIRSDYGVDFGDIPAVRMAPS